ncbi:MAG: zinc ribbon domain-containing protein [Gemmatimonadales bacterium]|jgi:putative FmdB family regulatory protein|nr:zinc ribbon domain-containing protein [Gemmatimonadales bacterium]
MPTYTYQTAAGRRFEVRQAMSDAPLTHDPDTGEAVERVISGGAGLLTSRESAKVGEPAQGGGCGGGCACAH